MGSPLAITSSDSSLDQTWSALRAGGRQALIPYLTAGYPSAEASREALQAAAEVSDMLEVGVPFSDPLADGPTIQRSTFEALRQGMTLPRTLDLIARAELGRPVIIFSYLNPILRYGIERFLADAAALHIAGLILTDVPPPWNRRCGRVSWISSDSSRRPPAPSAWPEPWKAPKALSTWSRAWG